MATRVKLNKQQATVSVGAADLLQPDSILTVQEVAMLLKVPVSWIYERTRRSGSERLPHIKLGKYLRFRTSEVLEWLYSQSRK